MIGVESADLCGAHMQTLEGVGKRCIANLHKAQKGVELTVINDSLHGANIQLGT